MVAARGAVMAACIAAWSTGARAEEATVPAAPALPERVAEDGVDVVYLIQADPMARWRDTRWVVQTQVGMPWPAALYAEFDHEVQFVAYDLEMVVHCDLGEPIGRGTAEVLCGVEDAALRVAAWRGAGAPWADQVVQEADARLTGLQLALQVAEDGRVLDLTLVHEPQTNRRVNTIYENLRQMVLRAMVGFHARLPSQWPVEQDMIERNSRIFAIPAFQFVPLGGGAASALPMPADLAIGGVASQGPPGAGPGQVGAVLGVDAALYAPNTPASGWSVAHAGQLQSPLTLGRSALIHRLSRYKGAYVMQTKGQGTLDVGADVPLTYTGTLDGVSVYDEARGFLTERRWALDLDPTAGNVLADGVAGWSAWQLGRLAWLEPGQRPTLGASGVVSRPAHEDGMLPLWSPMPP
jgi:hypothetical protein